MHWHRIYEFYSLNLVTAQQQASHKTLAAFFELQGTSLTPVVDVMHAIEGAIVKNVLLRLLGIFIMATHSYIHRLLACSLKLSCSVGSTR